MASPVASRSSRLVRRPIALLSGGFSPGSATRIFLLFFFAFLPLGVIALVGVIQAIRTTEQERVVRLQLSAEQRASHLARTISNDRRTLRLLVDTLPQGSANQCARAVTALAARTAAPLDFAMFDYAGRRVCSSPGGAQLPAYTAERFTPRGLLLDTAGQRLLIRLARGDDGYFAIGTYSRDALAGIIGLSATPNPQAPAHFITLTVGERQLTLNEGGVVHARETLLSAATPMDEQASINESIARPPTTLRALVILLLPIILWLFAAAIAWYSVHRLLVLPLVAMQRAVATYRPGDDPAPIRPRSALLNELNVLSETFRSMACDVSTHEQQMVDSLDRQRRLTREVHHRVKNNLQIIASLVSLHSRAATSDAAAQAYASIQRRVDALAVVHRNHFAEIEQNEGINGSALLSELASSLRGGGLDFGRGFALRVDCDQVMLDQDVAMPVAFILAEVFELAVRVDPAAPVSFSLKRCPAETDQPPRARLAVESAALRASPALTALLQEGFERVLGGLSRQLRSTSHWDRESGSYRIDVAILA